MNATGITIESDERGYTALIPTTLRELESIDIPLDSRFGIDEEEHSELLGKADMMRIYVRIGWNDEFRKQLPVITVQTLQATLANPSEHWAACVDWPRHNAEAARIRDRIESLPRVAEVIDDLRSKCTADLDSYFESCE